MYTVYINDRPLYLRGHAEPAVYASDPADHLQARYSGKQKSLLNYADTLEKGSPNVTSIELVHDDPERLWADFRAHYKWVEAAGGIVTNGGNGKQLFIFRRDYWDLPKGKLDNGEDAPTAALREVTEETGIEQLTLGKPLPTTYHTYRGKRNRILKPTYWFTMTTPQTTVVPEAAEGIEGAEWRSVAEMIATPEPLYESLRALLRRL